MGCHVFFSPAGGWGGRLLLFSSAVMWSGCSCWAGVEVISLLQFLCLIKLENPDGRHTLAPVLLNRQSSPLRFPVRSAPSSCPTPPFQVLRPCLETGMAKTPSSSSSFFLPFRPGYLPSSLAFPRDGTDSTPSVRAARHTLQINFLFRASYSPTLAPQDKKK